MPFYLLTLPSSCITPLLNGARSRVVHAASVSDARAAAKSSCGFDSDAAWDAATVTEIGAKVDALGVEIRATVISEADGLKKTYSYIGVASNGLNGLLNGLVAVMNADTATIPGTDASVSGLVLTIPADNNLGDKAITCALYLNGVAFASIGAAVSATGAKASVRTITLSGGTMQGVRMRITIADGTNPVDVSVWMHAGETIDAAAARLLVLFNAATLISGTDATYTSGTQTFSIPADNNVGDKVITCTYERDGIVLTDLATTVSAVGAAASIRTIVVPADGSLPVPTIPKVIASASVF